MTDVTDLKVGDRVKVTLEAEVTGLPKAATDGKYSIGEARRGHSWGWFNPEHENVTVEKIEPPAAQFQPGDAVKPTTGTSRMVVILGDTSYFRPSHGRWYDYGGPGNLSLSDFTSERYEKVDLSQL